MSWFGHTLLPVVQEVFGSSNEEAPTEPVKAAQAIRDAGHPDVADYVEGLNRDALEDLLWSVHINVINKKNPP